MARTGLVNFWEKGYTFSTIVERDGEWKLGVKVGIVTVECQKYIRTEADALATDNLGNLPRF